MIENFEDITADLSDSDKVFDNYVASYLKTLVGEQKATKARDIVDVVNHKIAVEIGYEEATFTEIRLRKLVNYYRSNGLIPVCSTSKGYFITFENTILKSQVRSLKQRANGILVGAKGLEKWIH